MNTEEKKRTLAWIVRDKYHGDAKAEGLKEDEERLVAGEPVDYIIGWKPFCGIEVDLSLQPLIPREETEYWVTQCITELRDGFAVQKQNFRFLDLCTGSGCIAASLLTAFPHTQGDCADNNSRMLEQVTRTMERNHLPQKRCRIIQSDMWQEIQGTYDLICANPPYVGEGEMVGDMVRKYEPHSAVFSGDAGTAELKKFFEGLSEHLLPRGIAYCEFGSEQGNVIRALLAQYSLNGRVCNDQFGRERFVRVDAEG